MRTIEYVVTKEYDQYPLLHFLKGHVKLSTRIVQTLRHTKGSVLVNGEYARLVDKVTFGDTVKIAFPETTSPPLLWETKLDVIFEDDDLLVINKPSGISVHPTFNHPNGTLCNAVAAYLKNKNNPSSVARAVGRLDKVTSGVMIFAKNAYAASKLNGNLDKTYLAVVNGITDESGFIEAPIFRPDLNKTIRSVDSRGDYALTTYKTLFRYNNISAVEVKTETGRTHQIRVHFSHIGHALVGDEMYGGKATENINRTALHCLNVSIVHPVTNEALTFKAPLPEDIKKEFEKNGISVDK